MARSLQVMTMRKTLKRYELKLPLWLIPMLAADLLTGLLGCIAATLCYKVNKACRCCRRMEGAA